MSDRTSRSGPIRAVYFDVGETLIDESTAGLLRGLPALSARLWGAEKPTQAFFTEMIASAGCDPHEIAYAGDRLDNDIVPALAAGLTTVFIRRRPWGYYYAS